MSGRASLPRLSAARKGMTWPRCEGSQLTSIPTLAQNTGMRRLGAVYSLASLFFALLFAPLFHLHESDEHGGVAVLHAHFPELEKFHHDAESDVEPNHSHEQVRSIDFLTSTIVSPATQSFVISDAPLFVLTLEDQRSVSSVDTPRTHSPPALDRSIPRSPPSE